MEKTNNPVMPLWVGDYLKDTSDLSLIEHGAYMRLIMYYWNNGGPMLKDMPKLFRGAGAFSPEEQTVIKDVLTKFFTDKDGKYSHKRIDAELQRTEQSKEKKVERAKAGAAARWSNNATSNASSIQQAMLQASNKQCLEVCLDDANLNPTLNPTLNPKPSLNQKPPKSPKGEGSNAFNLFWGDYPKAKRLDKAKCITMWNRSKLDVISDQVMLGLKQWVGSYDWQKEDGKYIPHASSFLSKRRWESAEAAKASIPTNKPKTVLTQYQDEAMERIRQAYGFSPEPQEKELKDVTPQQD